jgi:uncharacterized DUF497 family protein
MGTSEEFVYRFAWDPAKAVVNRRRHGVSFEQAATIFRDPLALSRYDDEHSETEERWLTLGEDDSGTLLVGSILSRSSATMKRSCGHLGSRGYRARARAIRKRLGR